MSTGADPCPVHPESTRRRGLPYCFYNAHHGFGVPDDSQWSTDLTADEEFAIFDKADWHDLSDDRGNLYGLRSGPDGGLRELGTRGGQVAKFWVAREGQPWHGFPLGPIAVGGPANRNDRQIGKAVLIKMESAGLLSSIQRKRLAKGAFAR